ncbi:galactose mutarotase [Massilia sp. PAMC28688]|uniref:aldose epimerase family protein n=1 Tax=Massilia sp. PAMC28688 TaxID=2861283 RepID=UPI001C636437|nr:aldose epimerase family protein [Massilia sp. PAMC28688]QYF92663.1 galactose mutarotase [Massilia sp. PAMC28688]
MLGTHIDSASFGTLPDGREAQLYTLVNRNGLVVKITNYGGIITELCTPDRDGFFTDITHGYDSVAPYVTDSPYFGALIGRFGNRIAGGRFELDGRTVQLDVNDGVNHLHGGTDGFHKVLWSADPFQGDGFCGLRLSYLSRDGEQGYPGNLAVTVVYTLNDHNELEVDYHAVTDQATPVNLTQHAYFNLAGHGSILSHEFEIDADGFLPIDGGLIPTGCIAPVEGTPFDFRKPRKIGERIDEPHEQLANGSGYDHNFVLNERTRAGKKAAVTVRDPSSGRVLELFTDQPGVQLYSGNFLDGSLTGKGWKYGHRGGFCIEPQHFPDAPNQPQFAGTILRPGEEYKAFARLRFSVDQGS